MNIYYRHSYCNHPIFGEWLLISTFDNIRQFVNKLELIYNNFTIIVNINEFLRLKLKGVFSNTNTLKHEIFYDILDNNICSFEDASLYVSKYQKDMDNSSQIEIPDWLI